MYMMWCILDIRNVSTIISPRSISSRSSTVLIYLIDNSSSFPRIIVILSKTSIDTCHDLMDQLDVYAPGIYWCFNIYIVFLFIFLFLISFNVDMLSPRSMCMYVKAMHDNLLIYLFHYLTHCLLTQLHCLR